MSRLPHVGGDDGNWGSILNDYLRKSLNSDGSIKSGAIGLSSLKDVHVASLHDNQILAYSSTTAKWRNKPVYIGNTPLTFEELEPVDAVMIGNALGYDSLPDYEVDLSSTLDPQIDLLIVNSITAVDNGALVVDGYTVQIGDRVAFWDNVSYPDYMIVGIYTVAAKGSAGSKFVLNRTADTFNGRNWIAPVLNSEKYGSNISVKVAEDPAGFEFWTLALIGRGSFAESSSSATGIGSHSEGVSTVAREYGSHAEGYFTVASSSSSHAEGANSTASGYSAHAEGLSTTSSNYGTHAEGSSTTASETAAHAEGNSTTASAYTAHAEGNNTTASGYWSHAEGTESVAARHGEHAESSGRFSDQKPTQVSRLTLGAETINGSMVIGFGDGNSTNLSLTNNRLSVIRIEIGAWRSSDDTASRWLVDATASRKSGTVRLIAPATITQTDHDSGANAWTVAVVISGGGLDINVTANSGTVRWVAVAEVVEIA